LDGERKNEGLMSLRPNVPLVCLCDVRLKDERTDRAGDEVQFSPSWMGMTGWN
jgi:hypothetical protein